MLFVFLNYNFIIFFIFQVGENFLFMGSIFFYYQLFNLLVDVCLVFLVIIDFLVLVGFVSFFFIVILVIVSNFFFMFNFFVLGILFSYLFLFLQLFLFELRMFVFFFFFVLFSNFLWGMFIYLGYMFLYVGYLVGGFLWFQVFLFDFYEVVEVGFSFNDDEDKDDDVIEVIGKQLGSFFLFYLGFLVGCLLSWKVVIQIF